MKAIKDAFFCATLVLILGGQAYGQIPANDGRSAFVESIAGHKPEIAQICGTAMSNILHDLKGLASRYSPMSDIGSVSVTMGESPLSANNLLKYEKNARYALYQVPPGGILPNAYGTQASGGGMVVEKGGASLTICLWNRIDQTGAIPVDSSNGGIYSLVRLGGISEFELIYSFYLNSHDTDLENAVREIVEKQVGILRKALREIIGADPATERVRVCAPAMSNILSELKGMAPQFPALSGVSSATVENKGGLYLYSHLRYWREVNGDLTTNAEAFQLQPIDTIPAIRKGGLALDVYLLNVDEPFGFISGKGYPVYTDEGKTKIELVYALHFNREDELTNSVQLRDTSAAIRGVIEKQAQMLRKAMDNIINF